jgi:hypothetical protein
MTERQGFSHLAFIVCSDIQQGPPLSRSQTYPQPLGVQMRAWEQTVSAWGMLELAQGLSPPWAVPCGPS